LKKPKATKSNTINQKDYTKADHPEVSELRNRDTDKRIVKIYITPPPPQVYDDTGKTTKTNHFRTLEIKQNNQPNKISCLRKMA
jgi:hypothetical protein